MSKKTIDEIKIIFEREFRPLKHLFEIYEVSVPETLKAEG